MNKIKIRLSGPCTGTVEVDGKIIDCRSVKFEGTAGELMMVTLVVPSWDVEIDAEGDHLVVVKKDEIMGNRGQSVEFSGSGTVKNLVICGGDGGK